MSSPSPPPGRSFPDPPDPSSSSASSSLTSPAPTPSSTPPPPSSSPTSLITNQDHVSNVILVRRFLLSQHEGMGKTVPDPLMPMPTPSSSSSTSTTTIEGTSPSEPRTTNLGRHSAYTCPIKQMSDSVDPNSVDTWYASYWYRACLPLFLFCYYIIFCLLFVPSPLITIPQYIAHQELKVRKQSLYAPYEEMRYGLGGLID
ncbi:hypothetical protein AN958_11162 [Leucoagaricus sp. SymC.cos]|nr:hypothetical protein AN958_11162 [Leucoagaricus sp. SymC.cos]